MRIKTLLLTLIVLVTGCTTPTNATPDTGEKGFQFQEKNGDVGKPFVQRGHTRDVLSIKFSPNEKYIASASGDNSIKLWDVKSGKNIKTFLGHKQEVTSIIFTPDGKHIISGSRDGSIKIWNVESGKVIRTLNHDSFVEYMELGLSPNGKYIVSGGGRAIKLWDIESGKNIKILKDSSNSYISSMLFTPNGKQIISAHGDKIIRVWDIESAKVIKVMKGHSKNIPSISLSSDRKYLISVDYDSIIILWDIESGKIIKKFNQKTQSDRIHSVLFSLDDKCVVSSGKKSIKFWNIESGEIDKEIIENSHYYLNVKKIAFNKNGKYIVGGTRDKINLWDVNSGKLIKEFKNELYSLKSVSFSSNSRYIVTGGRNGINLWDKKNKKIEVFEGKGGSTQSVKIINNHIISIDWTGNINIWDVKTKKRLKRLNANAKNLESMALSSDNKYLFVAGKEAIIRKWDIESGKELKVFDKAPASSRLKLVGTKTSSNIHSLVISKDDKFLFSNDGWYSVIDVWDTESGKLIKTLDILPNQVLSIALSSDDKYLTYGDLHGIIRTINIESGKVIRRFKHNTKSILDIIISNNEKTLISASQDGSIKIWDIESQKERRTLNAHLDCIYSMDLSVDEKFLVSCSIDGTTKLWDMKTGKELVSMMTFDDGEWIIITPDGYFDASKNGAKHLNILTDPLTVTSIDAYYEKFYRPDIVKLAMQGKTVAGLTKISDIKSAPRVEILNIGSSNASGQRVDSTSEDNIDVMVHITPKNGGVGEIRILVNGTARTLDTRAFRAKRSDDKPFDRTYNIKLTHGINEIKAFAFESTNSARSDESVYKIKSTFKRPHKPSIYALVIGIQEYRNSRFNLTYTRDDAKIFRDALSAQKKNGLFDDVHITTLLTKEETSKENILKELEKFKSMNPNDLFVFYVGSHGTVDDGSYYLITSNVGSASTRKLKIDALSQKELQVAISNIQASKKFIVLDTCNSGKLGAVLQQERVAQTRGMSESTAIKILSRAMGSTILSASKSNQEAIEGYKGHGLFTYVLVEGLNGKADSNRDGFVKTLELANYVEDTVPTISEQEFKHEQFPNVNVSGQAFPVSRVQ